MKERQAAATGEGSDLSKVRGLKNARWSVGGAGEKPEPRRRRDPLRVSPKVWQALTTVTSESLWCPCLNSHQNLGREVDRVGAESLLLQECPPQWVPERTLATHLVNEACSAGQGAITQICPPPPAREAAFTTASSSTVTHSPKDRKRRRRLLRGRSFLYNLCRDIHVAPVLLSNCRVSWWPSGKQCAGPSFRSQPHIPSSSTL